MNDSLGGAAYLKRVPGGTSRVSPGCAGDAFSQPWPGRRAVRVYARLYDRLVAASGANWHRCAR